MGSIVSKIKAILQFISDRFNYRFRREKLDKKTKKRIKKEKEFSKNFDWYHNACRYICGLAWPKFNMA